MRTRLKSPARWVAVLSNVGEVRPTTVLICDDHRAVADAVGFVIDYAEDVELATSPVSTPEEALQLVTELQPDVVLMDVDLRSEVDGFEATRRIRDVSSARVLIFTAKDDVSLLVDAVEAGACGILRKRENVDTILDAIRAAARGGSLIDADLLARLLREVAARRAENRASARLLDSLTDREVEIVQLLGEGLGNVQISQQLHISASTVQTHVRNVLSKLQVGSRLEAVVMAARNGAITVR